MKPWVKGAIAVVVCDIFVLLVFFYITGRFPESETDRAIYVGVSLFVGMFAFGSASGYMS